jgi:hypothetical protein
MRLPKYRLSGQTVTELVELAVRVLTLEQLGITGHDDAFFCAT